eukprot:g60591.t1
MHAYIESVYNGIRIPQEPWELGCEFVQFEMFKKYISEQKGWIPFRTELILYSERYMIAGSCDIVFLDPKTGLVYICDWKRSKRIWERSFQGLTGLGPCDDLSDCNLAHYHLQLNAYRFLFEAQVGKKVGSMYLAVFHPGQEHYKFLPVPDYSKKIATCFGIRRLNLLQKCITKLRVLVDHDRQVALQHCLLLDCLRCDVKLSCWRAVSDANNKQQRRQAWEKLVIPTILDEDIPRKALQCWVGIGHQQSEVKQCYFAKVNMSRSRFIADEASGDSCEDSPGDQGSDSEAGSIGDFVAEEQELGGKDNFNHCLVDNKIEEEDDKLLEEGLQWLQV